MTAKNFWTLNHEGKIKPGVKLRMTGEINFNGHVIVVPECDQDYLLIDQVSCLSLKISNMGGKITARVLVHSFGFADDLCHNLWDHFEIFG